MNGVEKSILDMLPNCKVFSTVKQSEDEESWKNARRAGIGGSDIGAICGVSPFTSARRIYLEKTLQYEDDADSRAAVSQIGKGAAERMYWGHALESIVADEFLKRNQDEVEGIYNLDATMQPRDPAFSWALANVDRIIKFKDGSLGVLECKTTSEYNKDEWESGDVLESYVYQLNWYMWILGLRRGFFACLVGGNKFFQHEIHYNDELVNKRLIPAAREFWNVNVKNMIEPELAAVDKEFVNELYKDAQKNSEVFLNDDTADDLASTVMRCKAEIKALTKTMEEAQNRLKEHLKDNEIAHTPSHVIKWSPRAQSRVDSAKLKKEYPEVAEACTKTINFRVMTVKCTDPDEEDFLYEY